MNTTTRDRRIGVLEELAEVTCEHTGNLAEDLNIAPSTLRRDLEWLELQGWVTGTLHDERDTLPNGRRRIYWSPTDAGRRVLHRADGSQS